MHNATPETFDVAIIGAGPAGCSAALQLARAGVSVVVFERRPNFQRRLGETLPPVANGVLRALNLWDDFLQTGPVPSSCNASAWGSSDLAFNDFLFDVQGHGWHIDRGQFESMLGRAAENAGAKLRLGSCVWSRAGMGANWLLEILSCRTRKCCRAEFLIDASGRSPNEPHARCGRRVVHDHLIAVGFYALLRVPDQPYGYTFVEAVDEGWFYSAQLSPREGVICYMTDADLYAHGVKHSNRYWQQQFGKTVHTRDRFDRTKITSGPFFATANTSVRTHVTGEDWMAIGDAAMSHDPLSSSGIYSAIKSGMLAAGAVMALKRGKTEDIDGWSQYVRTTFDSYLFTRRNFYEIERRWTESPFWTRRYGSSFSTRIGPQLP